MRQNATPARGILEKMQHPRDPACLEPPEGCRLVGGSRQAGPEGGAFFIRSPRAFLYITLQTTTNFLIGEHHPLEL